MNEHGILFDINAFDIWLLFPFQSSLRTCWTSFNLAIDAYHLYFVLFGAIWNLLAPSLSWVLLLALLPITPTLSAHLI